ncbi:UNVERIFIED_CONTAM: hypothetical protein HDU68_007218 [Siphonaria sp. JEL0065]|nr:hypothetical protein HDU68_007218 [Siphonaria sp. JEL0065]
MLKVDKHMLSRLLYTNPVCLLTTSFETSRNVMTISWLTPIDNNGHFMCSMNQNRFSATVLHQSNDSSTISPVGSRFVLNVPTADNAELVLKVGGCSGRDRDKYKHLGIESLICLPGGQVPPPNAFPWIWKDSVSTIETTNTQPTKKSKKEKRQDSNETYIQQGLIGLRNCCAHLVCVVDEVQQKYGHLILFCTIEDGWVKEEYWNGKNFCPRVILSSEVSVEGGGEGSDGIVSQPYLSFLGSQVFATVDRLGKKE